MPSVDKIIEKMRNQPNGIKLTDAEKVLFNYGYRLKRQAGSHRQYENSSGDLITIPANSPLKKFYVDQILARIGAI